MSLNPSSGLTTLGKPSEQETSKGRRLVGRLHPEVHGTFLSFPLSRPFAPRLLISTPIRPLLSMLNWY